MPWSSRRFIEKIGNGSGAFRGSASLVVVRRASRLTSTAGAPIRLPGCGARRAVGGRSGPAWPGVIGDRTWTAALNLATGLSAGEKTSMARVGLALLDQVRAQRRKRERQYPRMRSASRCTKRKALTK